MKTRLHIRRIWVVAALLAGNAGHLPSGLQALGATVGSLPTPAPAVSTPVYTRPAYVPPVYIPPVVVTPPPIVVTPPPVVRVPMIVVPPPTTHLPPNLNPTDVTTLWMPAPGVLPENAAALYGIKVVNGFPTAGKDEEPGILARGAVNAEFKKISAFAVKYTSGDVIVSIRKPCRLGLVETALGTVALTGDADVMLSAADGVLHIFNLTGNGESVKVKFNSTAMQDETTRTFALAPGYELIAAARKLTAVDIRRPDAIARRHSKMIQNGQVAVCEYSLESVLSSSSLIAKLASSDAGPKDRRMITDLSKMAAVLNQLNGEYGYTVEQPAMASK